MRAMKLGMGSVSLRVALVAASALLGASSAFAQGSGQGDDDQSKIVDDEKNLEDEIARNHHRTGSQYYEAGRFREAGDEFSKSYKLSKRPIALFNAYIAYRDAGEDKKAAEALRKYLAEAKEIDDRQNLEARLENLEARLKALEARDEEIRQKEQEAEAAREAALKAEQEAEAKRNAQTGSNVDDGPGAAPFILMGVGGAMVVGGVVTGIINRGTVSELEDACPNEVCPAGQEEFLESKQDTAELTALLTDIFIFGGAAVAASGLIWYLVAQPDDDEAPMASAYCTGDGCGAVLQGSF